MSTIDQSFQINLLLHNSAITNGICDLKGAAFNLLKAVVMPPGIKRFANGSLIFPGDLGPGVVGLSADPTPQAACAFENIIITGPGANLPLTLGRAPAQMDLFQPGSFSTVRNVHVSGGRLGIRVIDDHVRMYDVRSSGNLRGVGFDANPRSKSNHVFVGCWFDGNAEASIWCAGSNCIDGSELIGCHLGFSPYGIIKDNDPDNVASALGLLWDTLLLGCEFESVGNGAILDRSTGTGSGLDTLKGSTIQNPYFRWCFGGENYRLPSAPADFALSVRNVERTTIIGGNYDFTPGAVGVLDASVRAQLDYHCGVNGLPLNLVAGPNAAKACDTVLRIVAQGWDCIAQPRIAASALQAGQIVAQNEAWYTVEPYTGGTFWAQGTPKPFAGVALTGASTGQVIIVATCGTCQAMCEPVAVAGWPLYAVPGSPRFQGVVNGERLAVSQGPGGAVGGGLTTIRIG